MYVPSMALADLTDPEAVRAAIAEFEERGPLDVVLTQLGGAVE